MLEVLTFCNREKSCFNYYEDFRDVSKFNHVASVVFVLETKGLCFELELSKKIFCSQLREKG